MRTIMLRSIALSSLLGACSQPIDATGPSGETDPTSDTSDPGTDPTDPNANDAPVAIAGADIDSIVTDEIELDGSDSYDPDGDEISFEWAFVSAPIDSGATIINEDRVGASFFADVPGVYLVELVVRDGSASASDQVQINVNGENEAPIADAGPDQTVDVGDTVVMNGSDSDDPDGDEITFAWTLAGKPGASTSFLDAPTDALSEFVPDVAGTYIVQLIVSDGITTSSVDSAIITAKAVSGGGGGTTGSGCLSCSAAQREIKRQVNPNGFGLGLAPLGLVLLRRRRR